MIINILQFLSILLIAVIFHELGHMIAGMLCGVKIKEFCIGFWKPKISKVIKGVKVSLTPILLGGYTAFKGEYEAVKGGFLNLKYRKKIIVLLAGIFVNLIIAFICYLINYNSIFVGLKVDLNLLSFIFTKNETYLIALTQYNPNLYLLNLSLFNLACALFNLIPYPSLDGSLLWLVLLQKPLGSKFGKILQKVCWIGFISLIILQIPLIWILL